MSESTPSQPTEETPVGKVCSGPCGLWKPFTEFHYHPHGKGGVAARCKACIKASRFQTEPTPDKKQCNGPCGEIKPAEEFHKRAASKDGLALICKACQKAKGKARYEANRDEIRAKHKAYYDAHAEERKAYTREWWRRQMETDPEGTREKGRLKAAAQRAADPERFREAARRWREANPEKAKESTKRSNTKRMPWTKPERRAYKLQWARDNRELKAEQQRRHRSRKKTTIVARFTPAQQDQRFAMFGHRCWMCGGSGRLEPDHVKPLSKGGPHLLSAIRPSCGRCNKTKNAQWFGVRETIARFRTWVPAPVRLP